MGYLLSNFADRLQIEPPSVSALPSNFGPGTTKSLPQRVSDPRSVIVSVQVCLAP